MKFTGTGGIIGRFLLRSGPPHLSAHTVEQGDRFFQIGAGSACWAVDRIYSAQICQIPHAVISRGGSFPETKVLSVPTLQDASLYRADRRNGDREHKTGKCRRIDDPPRRN